MRYAPRMPVRALLARIIARIIASILATLGAAALAACGHAVRIQGTADQVFDDAVGILRIQGVMPPTVEPGKERPRVDRAAGEIDLLYTQSVYYGDGAAFVQVDVDDPSENRERTVRMWVDFPVGNRVVRYGRALDEKTTEQFVRDFEVALAKYRETHPPRRAPAPEGELVP